MLDYKQLEAVARVILEASFEKAAERLHITQSAVSQRVRALEEQLGCILIVRTAPVRPTHDGQRIVEHFLKVVQLESDLATTMRRDEEDEWVTLPVAVNADSLATWFLDAVTPLLQSERVLIDVITEDQEHTYALLREGRVAGCISTRAEPVQGWRSLSLGDMPSQCFAAPCFAAQWFPQGLTQESILRAPAVLYNRKDSMHHRYLMELFGDVVSFPAHYVPSSERFVDVLLRGLGYGIVPALQAQPYVEQGLLVDLAPNQSISIRLYWHYWGLQTRFVEKMTECVVAHARRVLST